MAKRPVNYVEINNVNSALEIEFFNHGNSIRLRQSRNSLIIAENDENSNLLVISNF